MMLTENLEDTVVLISQQGVHIACNRLGLTAREAQLTTHLSVHTDIQLCNMDMLYDGCILGDSSVDVFLCRTIDIVVALHTDTINGYTGILHLLYHVVDAITLARVTLVVVVIEQQGVGVCLTSKLESLGNELITAELEVTALAIGATRSELTVSK